jgi:cytidylate kinase
VAEGRDIGTVIAPQAELKIWLTASPEERARRRARELGQADWRMVLRDQTLRDQQDESREHSPLRAAPDSIEIDSTDRTLEDVVTQIAGLVRDRRAR